MRRIRTSLNLTRQVYLILIVKIQEISKGKKRKGKPLNSQYSHKDHMLKLVLSTFQNVIKSYSQIPAFHLEMKHGKSRSKCSMWKQFNQVCFLSSDRTGLTE